MLVPAAFTSTSTWPNRASTSAAIFLTASGSPTSQGKIAISAAPCALAAVSFSASARRPINARRQPSRANNWAMARPTPLPAPVRTMVEAEADDVVTRNSLPQAAPLRLDPRADQPSQERLHILLPHRSLEIDFVRRRRQQHAQEGQRHLVMRLLAPGDTHWRIRRVVRIGGGVVIGVLEPHQRALGQMHWLLVGIRTLPVEIPILDPDQ